MKTRRPTSSVAFIPKAEGRASSVERPKPFTRQATPDTRHPENKRSGMTMIELGIVMGIVSVLIALVLGLGRHINATVKIRRAQADLGEWHETLNRWHLQFGEYPFGLVRENGEEETVMESATPEMNLSNVLSRAYVQFALANGGTTNITLLAYRASNVSHIDPWGTPYIYTCDASRRAYTLFSCGPDASSVLNGVAIGTASPGQATLDDIYFER